MEKDRLRKILIQLIDEIGITNRNECAKTIRVTHSFLDECLAGKALPSPEHLNALRDMMLFDTRVPAKFIEEFEALLDLPLKNLTEVSVSHNETLGGYMLTPLREGFNTVLTGSPAWIQENVLRTAGELCWRLRENQIQPTVEEQRKSLFGNPISRKRRS